MLNNHDASCVNFAYQAKPVVLELWEDRMTKSRVALMAVCIFGLLFSFIPGSYYHPPTSSSLDLLLLLFSVFAFVPVSLLVCTILNGYLLTRFSLIKSPYLLLGYACLIGVITYAIPTIRYHTGNTNNNVSAPSSWSLLAFAGVLLLISLLSGCFGLLQQRFRKLLLILLLIIAIGSSFSWTGGGLLLRGLGMVRDHNILMIETHPRIALLGLGALCHVPIHEKVVTLLLGYPQHKFSSQSKEEWSYQVQGYAPYIYYVFNSHGWLVDMSIGEG